MGTFLGECGSRWAGQVENCPQPRREETMSLWERTGHVLVLTLWAIPSCNVLKE